MISPPSSATELVSPKYRKKSLGSLSATRRPAHQPSTTETILAWFSSRGALTSTTVEYKGGDGTPHLTP